MREDVLDDFTSIELARDAYGVVFADERTLEIDAAATEKLRAELAASRTGELADGVVRGPGAAARLAPRSPRRANAELRSTSDRSKAYERVAGRLREQILEGVLEEGAAAEGDRARRASSASAARRSARRCGC